MDRVYFRDPIEAMGFTPIPNAILTHPGLKDREKVVYALLRRYAWEKDHCFPSQKRLAFEAGNVSVDVIQTALNSLREKGLITWERVGKPAHNVYYLEPLSQVEFLRNIPRFGEDEAVDTANSPLDTADLRHKEDTREEENNTLPNGRGQKPFSFHVPPKRQVKLDDLETVRDGETEVKPKRGRRQSAFEAYRQKRAEGRFDEFTANDLFLYFKDRYQEIKGVPYVTAEYAREIRQLGNLAKWVGGAAVAVRVIDAYFARKGPNAVLSATHFSKELVKELMIPGYRANERKPVEEVTESEEYRAENKRRLRELLGD